MTEHPYALISMCKESVTFVAQEEYERTSIPE